MWKWNRFPFPIPLNSYLFSLDLFWCGTKANFVQIDNNLRIFQVLLTGATIQKLNNGRESLTQYSLKIILFLFENRGKNTCVSVYKMDLWISFFFYLIGFMQEEIVHFNVALFVVAI